MVCIDKTHKSCPKRMVDGMSSIQPNNVMLLVEQFSKEYEELAADSDPECSSMPLPLTHPLDFDT